MKILLQIINHLIIKGWSKFNTNYTYESQYDLHYSEFMEIGGIKHGVKIGKFKDDNEYVLGNKGDNLQSKLLSNSLDHERKYDK